MFEVPSNIILESISKYTGRQKMKNKKTLKKTAYTENRRIPK